MKLFSALAVLTCVSAVLIPNDYVLSPTGEATTFVTGLFYCLQHEELNSLVTYHPKGPGDVFHNLVVRGQKEYMPKGIWRNSVLFSFRHFNASHYQLYHKEIGVHVTYSPRGRSQADDILALTDSVHYRTGGKWEQSTLFTILRYDKDFYKLFNLEVNSVVTYSPKNTDQFDNLVVTKRNTEYQKGGSSERATLFRVLPQEYKIFASISQFKYDSPISDHGWLSLTGVDKTSPLLTVTNESPDNADAHQLAINKSFVNTVSWSFNESKVISLLKDVRTNLVITSEFVNAISGLEDEIITTWDPSELTTKSLVLDPTLVSLASHITVSPRKSAQFSLKWKKLDVSVGFNATVSVRVLADRLHAENIIEKLAPVDRDAVASILQHHGVTDGSRQGSDVLLVIQGSLHIKGVVGVEVVRKDLDLDTQNLDLDVRSA